MELLKIPEANDQITNHLNLLGDEKYCKCDIEKVMIRKDKSMDLAVKEQKDGEKLFQQPSFT